jgi:flagellar biosynthetic protein FlhB
MAEHDDREQRTEEATPRRRQEARERGQVALSSELVAAVGLAAGAGLLAVGGAQLARAVGGVLERGLGALASLGTSELSVPQSAALVERSATSVLGALCALLVPTVLLCALAGYAQVGFRIAPRAIEADAGKLDPVRGLQRLFGPRALVRTGLSLAKVLLITAAAATVAWLHVDEIARVGSSELGPLLAAVGVVALRTTAAALAVILALALLDALFQRLQLERDLRMTRAEVKEEHRLTEGDPHVRARIRALQRELATRRMMEDVPKATVVVTNPTHYAVALRYEREPTPPGSPAAMRIRSTAPMVVAKGVDHVAEKIKDVAREHGVALHEDVALARALHARVQIGQEIPEELYAAVAAVLATIYRLQAAHAGGTR